MAGPWLAADRIAETTVTTGTGTITLSGAKNGFSSFASAFASGATVYYCVTDNSTQWEVGKGTFTSPSTLTRDTLLASSTGSTITLVAGTKDVFVSFPAVNANKVELLNSGGVYDMASGII